GERETEEGITYLEASAPAVVSVSEKINEPRYPSFKGIMAAKKKPVETLTVADLGVDADAVGLSGASCSVVESAPKPPRQAGERASDEGDRGTTLAVDLVELLLLRRARIVHQQLAPPDTADIVCLRFWSFSTSRMVSSLSPRPRCSHRRGLSA